MEEVSSSPRRGNDHGDDDTDDAWHAGIVLTHLVLPATVPELTRPRRNVFKWLIERNDKQDFNHSLALLKELRTHM